MNSPKILIPLLVSSAAVLAQSPLRVADTSQTTLVWQQNVDETETAVVEFDQLPGERTLLLSHVTIDENVCGSVVAAGVINALPFLASPVKQQWQLTAAELVELSNYHFTGFAPMVPPRRIASHLLSYSNAQDPRDFGPTNLLSSGFATHVTSPSIVGPTTLLHDERRPWNETTWAWDVGHAVHDFDTTEAGRTSVFLAAHEYVLAHSLPPINQTGLTALGSVLDATIGFEIYLQAAHVKPTTGAEVEVRIGRHARIRRRSLPENTLWPLGPRRSVPAPTHASSYVYLAPRGDFMHVEFEIPVGTIANPTSLRAYVPTTNGLVLVDQVANPTFEGDVLKPHVGIFPCPADAVDGIMYIEQVSNPGQRFGPIGHYGHAAIISAYDIPSGPLIPPMPPAGIPGGTGTTGGSGGGGGGPQ